MKKIKIDVFDITIEKNKRARHLKLRFDPKGNVKIVIPWWVSYRTGEKFAQDNLEWMHKHRPTRLKNVRFTDGLEILLFGQPVQIVHQPLARRGVWVENGCLYVSGPSESIHRRVRDFIRKQAYGVFQSKSIELAAQIGRRPKRITLRDTSSRWGSCSSAGCLSFCWRLALAPDYVLEYIVAHEVSHLAHMNHGSDFWKTVGSLTTHQADAHIWLKKNGSSLQIWE